MKKAMVLPAPTPTIIITTETGFVNTPGRGILRSVILKEKYQKLGDERLHEIVLQQGSKLCHVRIQEKKRTSDHYQIDRGSGYFQMETGGTYADRRQNPRV